MKGKEDGCISKVSHEDSILCDRVLNAIQDEDEEEANDKLRDDEEKVERELIECENISSVFATKAGMVGIVDAHTRKEDPNPPDHESIYRAPAYC